MNNEEKARELAIKSTIDIDNKGNEVYNGLVEAALQEMAAWKEQQMIEKACAWLEKNIAEATGIDSYAITESFKQAMEE